MLFKKKKKVVNQSKIVVAENNNHSNTDYNRLKDNILHFGVLGKKVFQVEAAILGEGKTVVTILPDTAERYFSTPLFDGE